MPAKADSTPYTIYGNGIQYAESKAKQVDKVEPNPSATKQSERTELRMTVGKDSATIISRALKLNEMKNLPVKTRTRTALGIFSGTNPIAISERPTIRKLNRQGIFLPTCFRKYWLATRLVISTLAEYKKFKYGLPLKLSVFKPIPQQTRVTMKNCKKLKKIFPNNFQLLKNTLKSILFSSCSSCLLLVSK